MKKEKSRYLSVNITDITDNQRVMIMRRIKEVERAEKENISCADAVAHKDRVACIDLSQFEFGHGYE